MMKVQRYTPDRKQEWNAFAATARNATLLHQRDYMDYHADRFKDASLLFTDGKDRLMALFPACISNSNEAIIISHQGLTYGGFIISKQQHTFEIEEIMQLAITYYKEKMSARHLVIKTIPHIYCSAPCEEELYLIHIHGGQLTGRSLSQAICLQSPVPMSTLRKRCISKAQKYNLTIREATERREWNEYHSLLDNVLHSRHDVPPVHTADELWQLHSAFPRAIRLFAAYEGDTLQAGTIIYISPAVAHTQYLASSDRGLQTGALDLVVSHLITHDCISDCRYLDFGISTERDGSLNQGLTLQKEGFGARGICYDTYTIEL